MPRWTDCSATNHLLDLLNDTDFTNEEPSDGLRVMALRRPAVPLGFVQAKATRERLTGNLDENGIIGVDEAGRGAWAGPVVVAACWWSGGKVQGLDDSKKLTAKKREEWRSRIEREALGYAIVAASSKRVDRDNVLKSTMDAMALAVNLLIPQIELRQKDGATHGETCAENTFPAIPDIIIDGPHVPADLKGLGRGVVKADSLHPSVMAASVLAKTSRDAWMSGAGERLWPGYGWPKHKGYGTKAHQEALEQLGPCGIHRMSYRPVQACLMKR